MTTQAHEVVVIGGGLLGLATGWALAARGRDVVVLERGARPGHDAAGSKGSCRIFRLGYPDPDYVGAARLARDLWHRLEASSGLRILRPAPQLTIGAGLPAVQAAMRAAGADCDLITEAEAAARFPALRTGGPALLEPESAVIAADQALTALADGAGDVRTGVTVQRLSDDGRQVTVVTSAGRLTASSVVVTAGPWSGRLLATAGIAVPGRATLEQVAYLRPAEPASAEGPGTPIFLSHSPQSPYGLPVPDSPLFKIGIHPSGPAVDPDHQVQTPDDGLTGRLAEVARHYLPGYQEAAVAVERCCYDNSPDEDFIVDRIGNVVIGSGTSGHGFKFGPLLGAWLADLASGATAGSDAAAGVQQRLLARFALGRFEHRAA